MSSEDPVIAFRQRDAGPAPERLWSGPHTAANIAFDRRELGVILNLYGHKVAGGEWRDYAIDFGPDQAVFSVFRRTSEVPLYRIVKDPRLARKQGAYAVLAQSGLVLRRGHDLAQVLRVLAKAPKLVSL